MFNAVILPVNIFKIQTDRIYVYIDTHLYINTKYSVLSATAPSLCPVPIILCCPELLSPASCPNKCYVAGAYVMKRGRCLAHPLSRPVAWNHHFKHLRTHGWTSRLILLATDFMDSVKKCVRFQRSICYGSLWALGLNEWMRNTRLPWASGQKLQDQLLCVCMCVCVWERQREREREGGRGT